MNKETIMNDTNAVLFIDFLTIGHSRMNAPDRATQLLRSWSCSEIN